MNGTEIFIEFAPENQVPISQEVLKLVYRLAPVVLAQAIETDNLEQSLLAVWSLIFSLSAFTIANIERIEIGNDKFTL